MDWLILAFVGFAVVTAIVFTVARRRSTRGQEPSDIFAKGKLLSDSEQTFLRILEVAVQGQYRIATKVRLLDVIEPQMSARASRHGSVLSRIGHTSLDFVLCDNETNEALAAIRLDDRKRSSGGHGRVDEFLEAALHSANIHLIRIEAQPTYTTAHLAAQIESVFARDFIETLTLTPSVGSRSGLSLEKIRNL
jgi:hypothetical protein